MDLNLKYRLKLITALPSTVKWLFGLSFVLMLFIKFVFNNQTELFKGAAIWGDIFFNLCLSTISSVIFYFFLVHLKEFSEKEVLNPVVIDAANGLLTYSRIMLRMLSNESKVEISGYNPSKEELKLICNKINPLADGPIICPINLKKICWILCLNDTVINSSVPIDRLFLLIHHLPSPLIKLVIEVKQNSLFNIITFSTLKPENCGVRNLDFMSYQMIKYFELMHDLRLYLIANYPEIEKILTS